VAALRVDDDSVGELVATIDQRADSGTVQWYRPHYLLSDVQNLVQL
jgi:hypothetical protein